MTFRDGVLRVSRSWTWRAFGCLGVMVAGAAASEGATSSGAANVSHPYIVVLKDGVNTEKAAHHAETLGGEVDRRYHHALNGYAARLSSVAAAAIRADDRTLFVAEDGTVAAAGQSLPIGVDRIDGELSSARSGDGGGSVDINVAVVDTGIYSAHPDLNVVGGVDCLKGRTGHSRNVRRGTDGDRDARPRWQAGWCGRRTC